MNKEIAKTETNKELAKLDLIIEGADKVIEDPSKSLKTEIGIYKNDSNNWVFAKGGKWELLGLGIVAGEAVVVGTSALSVIGTLVGVTAGAGLVATGGGLSATGVGIGIGLVLVVVGGALLIRAKKKAKREKEEKDRMYREIIKKQQAAINRQKEINRILEEKLRQVNDMNRFSQEEINSLKQQIQNLQEVIELLTEQLKQFDKAA